MTHLLTIIAQATQPVTAPSGWQNLLDTIYKMLIAVVSIAVTVVIIPWIRLYGMKLQSELDATNAKGTTSKEQNTILLSERVKKMTVGLAELFADHKFPELANKIISGQLKTKEDVKAELYSWSNDLKTALIGQLSAQGIDGIAQLGEPYIDSVIERAAAAVSPFPGKETAVALLEGGAKDILQNGVNYVRAKNKTAPPGAAPLSDAVAAVMSADAAGGTSMSISTPSILANVPNLESPVVSSSPVITAISVTPAQPAIPRVWASGPVTRPQK